GKSSETRRRGSLSGGRTDHDARAGGGEFEAQSRTAIGGSGGGAPLRYLGRGKGGGRGHQGEGPRQDRRVAGPMGRRQGRAATEARRGRARARSCCGRSPA